MRLKALVGSVFATAALALAPGAAAAPTGCAAAVLQDWSDGRIDAKYPLHCYQQALDRMPNDLRSYSDASGDIERAMLARVRKAGRSRDSGGAPTEEAAAKTFGTSAAPLPLLVLGGFGLVLVLAGSGGVVVRLLRRRRPTA